MAVIVAALWVGALGPGAVDVAASARGDAGDGRGTGAPVMVVSVPDLTWSMVDAATTPEIWSIVTRSSVALLSTRTADEVDTPAAAYLTLGSGRRAGVAAGPAAGLATQSGEAVVVPGFGLQVERNEVLDYGAVPGSLGGALAGAGVRVAVVGDAALGRDDPTGRAVALGTADPAGRTPTGRVDGLLAADPSAPGGAWMDRTAVVETVGSELGPDAVVLVEASDLQRALRSGDPATRAVGLSRTDALVGALLDLVDDPAATVILVAPTSPGEVRTPGVFAWRGPGVDPGLASSGSTRREGYVSLTDLASTVLGVVGVAVPEQMGDTPVRPHVGPTADPGSRVSELAGAERRSVARDGTVGPLAVAVVLLAVLCGLLGVAAVWRRRPLRPWATWLCLAATAVPAVSFTTGIWPGVEVGPVAVVAWTALLAAFVGAAALVVGGGAVRWAVLVPAAVSVVLLVGDVVGGGRLQIDTPLGYSATVAGRFSGLGNQASAYLLGAALVLVASGWQWLGSLGWSRPRRLSVAVPSAALVVAVVGAPWWGADVGGALCALPALVVCIALSWRDGRSGGRVALVVLPALAVAALGLFVLGLWDRGRPASERTHLGRFVEDLLSGGAGEVLARKLSSAWEVTTSTPWSLVVPVLLIALASLAWLPRSRRWGVVVRRPELSAFGGAAAVGGVLGWVLNDSGVAVPAAVLAIAVPYVACVAGVGGRPAAGEPGAVDPVPQTVGRSGVAAADGVSSGSAP